MQNKCNFVTNQRMQIVTVTSQYFTVISSLPPSLPPSLLHCITLYHLHCNYIILCHLHCITLYHLHHITLYHPTLWRLFPLTFLLQWLPLPRQGQPGRRSYTRAQKDTSTSRHAHPALHLHPARKSTWEEIETAWNSERRASPTGSVPRRVPCCRAAAQAGPGASHDPEVTRGGAPKVTERSLFWALGNAGIVQINIAGG